MRKMCKILQGVGLSVIYVKSDFLALAFYTQL